MSRKRFIFDLDGTCALVDHRRHFVEREHQDWPAFYAACVDDLANEPIIDLMWRLWTTDAGIIEIWSGRSDEVEAETRAWLERHCNHFDVLRMRPEGDYTPDDELKEGWLMEVGIENVAMVFDDRDKVVSMWRSHGLVCCQVAPGDF